MAGRGDQSNARTTIARNALGIAIAAGAYGISFGAISVSAGLSIVQTCVLSLAMFTGASQFALVGVLGAGGAVASSIATALLLGARNTLYGLRLAGTLGVHGPKRLLAAQIVIDETTAMAIAQDDRADARFAFWRTGGLLFALWNIGTLIGAVSGSAIGEPETYGLDAAVPCAFLALMWPGLATARMRFAAVAGAAVALILVPLVPAGIPVLAAGGVAVLLALQSRDPDTAGPAATTEEVV